MEVCQGECSDDILPYFPVSLPTYSQHNAHRVRNSMESTVNLVDLSHRIEKVLRDNCQEWERVCDISPAGGEWIFMLSERVRGGVSCEDNAEDLKVATVTLSVLIGAVMEDASDSLVDLLYRSGNLINASLSVFELGDVPDDMSGFLAVEVCQRHMALSFNVERIPDYIENLVWQIEAVLPDYWHGDMDGEEWSADS